MFSIQDAKKILVTGADGFIGSHLVERLIERGLSVRAFTYYNSFNSWGWIDTFPDELRAKLEVFSGDIRDATCVREAVRDCDVVFHLAALIAIPYSYRSPESYVETNIRGTLNVVQAVKDFGVRRVVVTSTSEVYGTAQEIPITEEHRLHAQSPYAATKIAADQLALSFHRSFGTPVAVIRPFNTYGPRQSLRAVIPTVITQLAVGKNKINLGALSPTRDFNFVVDTAEAFIHVAECDECIGEVVNVGSGAEISIGDLVGKLARLMGREVEIVSDEERLRPETSEVFRLLADSSRIRRLTKWRAENDLDQGLNKTIGWFTRPENLRLYQKIDRYNV